jgi:hypothetical protein
MITKISISLSWIEPPPTPQPPRWRPPYRVMPQVLDRYGLSLELEQVPDAERRPPLAEVIALFDVTIACIEEALAN